VAISGSTSFSTALLPAPDFLALALATTAAFTRALENLLDYDERNKERTGM
jgi:hypothetical protein